MAGLSLKTQIYALVVALALVAYAAALYTNINGMRHYQQQQLASHAQDAAHHLGLSIAPYLDEQGLVLAETMASALFDSGYYQQIQFETLSGEVVFQRHYPAVPHSIPAWFSRLFPLAPPLMSTEVSNGWIPAGRLLVQSHPGAAYQALWHQAQQLSSRMLIALLLCLVAGYLILQRVLRPLHSIHQQAEAVMRKDFTPNPEQPFTLELRSVVHALNRMVATIAQSFQEQTLNAERLSTEVYKDSLTGLRNRRALLQQFELWRDDATAAGDQLTLLMLDLPSLTAINTRDGYSHGDAYVCQAAGHFARLLPEQHCALYRLSGSEFAILAWCSEQAANHLLQALNDEATRLQSDAFPAGFARCRMTRVLANESFTDCMQRLDTSSHPHLADPKHPTFSRETWQTLLAPYTRLSSDEPIRDKASFLQQCEAMSSYFDWILQPVVNTGKEPLYIESFVRFRYQQQQLSTAETFAMAERLQLALPLEKAVLCYTLWRLQGVEQTPVAINLSNAFIKDPEQQDWLLQLLDVLQADLPPLLFEIKESAFLQAPDHLTALVDAFKARQIRVVIDQFGASLSAFHYMLKLDVDFVKVDGSLIRHLEDEKTRFYVQSMVQICHGIGIKVLAASIEHAAVEELCQQLHLDGLQGHGIAVEQKFTVVSQEKLCNGGKTSLESLIENSLIRLQ